MAKEAYKTHRAGSIKGETHRIFDKEGRDAAIKYATAKAQGLQESTAKVWTSTWGRDGKKGTARRAPAVAKKEAPARKAAVKGKTSAKKKQARAKAKPATAAAE